ncbi:MAG: DegT/DnrJ/EryC1/StrS family aminotransferase [Clostridiaceae bacterium]|nr:DegT/DnrJ/EryC1/StrS family aminotransferase [Clostridiaceae bacterium]
MRKISFSPPDISDLEINEIVETLRSGWITTGPRTHLFEDKLSEYYGNSKTVCLNSATAALEMSLRVLGVGPGDEVITPAYTYTASASVIEHVGAKIVLIDSEPNTYELNYEQLAGAITEKTKAVIPVDIGGVMVDYDKVYEAVKSKKHLYHPSNDIQAQFDHVIVISDAAHSFGATYHGKKAGAAADLSCFSFHAVKNLTTAEGGAVTWIEGNGFDNEKLYTEFQLYSLHGQNKDAAAKLKPGAWEYDIIYPGYKCNMTDLTAAFGLKQLERFDSLIARRKQISEIYDEILLPTGIERMAHNREDRQGNYHLYLTRIPGIDHEKRCEIITKMAMEGVACNVHFKPLPMMTAYKNMGFDIADYPWAFKQYVNEITLPMHTLLTDEDAVYVAEMFRKTIKQ